MRHLSSGSFACDYIVLKLYSLILILGFMQWLNILIMKITLFNMFNLCASGVILFYSNFINKNMISWLAFNILNIYFWMWVCGFELNVLDRFAGWPSCACFLHNVSFLWAYQYHFSSVNFVLLLEIFANFTLESINHSNNNYMRQINK